MDIRELSLPFRVGSTSYVIEDDLVANARYASDFVQDMQLVLFDLPNGPSNLPDAKMVEALRSISRNLDLTYTVHLIEDLRLNTADGRSSRSVARARQVIELTCDLDPLAYVLHLDGKEFRQTKSETGPFIGWREETVEALSMVSAFAGDPALLAVENLEGYPSEFVTPVVERTPVRRCIDVGHLWLDGLDPLPHLRSALPRTRVIHIHGVHERDHESLDHSDPDALDDVISLLLNEAYDGVLTLEVFGRDDFETSMQALFESIQRCRSSND